MSPRKRKYVNASPDSSIVVVAIVFEDGKLIRTEAVQNLYSPPTKTLCARMNARTRRRSPVTFGKELSGCLGSPQHVPLALRLRNAAPSCPKRRQLKTSTASPTTTPTR